MDVILSSIQNQGIASILRGSVFAAALFHCIIAIAMPHLNELSSATPAQDVSTARDDGKVHLLLAASGSVATIKIPNIIRGLAQHPNLSIRLVLTSSAAHFLQGQADEQPSLAEIRKFPNVDAIYTDESEWVQPWTRGAPILHIELRKCELKRLFVFVNAVIFFVAKPLPCSNRGRPTRYVMSFLLETIC